MIVKASLCTVCVLFSMISVHAVENIPLARVMTHQEMQDTGMNQASDKQKAAMEQWLASWTHKVIDQAPTYRESQNLADWIQHWPPFQPAKDKPLTQQEKEEKQRKNMVVDRIRNNGEFIDLLDGSSWKIAEIYQPLAYQWRRNDRVNVGPSGNDLFPYALYNPSLDQTVQAKLMQAISPTGERKPEPSNFYQGSQNIGVIRGAGEFVTLKDQTIWRVAPMDKNTVQNWLPSDRIRVESSSDFLYHYYLHNLDNGQKAKANQSTIKEEKEILP